MSATSRQLRFYVTFAFFMALFGRHAFAADFATDFEAANRMYEEGHFADAANAYDKLIATGKVSEALYFNRGNALFKLGQVGRAIASYRQAQVLAPRDGALRGNLQFARTRARGGSPYHPPRWRALLENLSLNEWTVLTALAFWGVFVMLASLQWKPELKDRLRNPLITTGAIAVLLAACFGIMLNLDYYTTTAIVVSGEADVRNGPLDEAPSVFKVRDGIELEVVDRKDNWYQVADAADREGWLRDDQVVIFDPATSHRVHPLTLLDGGSK